jgi:DNA repair protein RadC
MEEMCYLDREHFRVVLLNTKNQVLAVETISVGGLSSSLVHPREVFKRAIQRSAAALILVHNHPSGDPTPSSEDLEVTKRLQEAGKILGIEVLDHIIIGDHQFISLKEMAYL